MNEKSVDITILCKVVDNFGDIGVTWRLARHLNTYIDKGREEDSYLGRGAPTGDLSSYRAARLRFVCDDLVSFSKINDKIDADKTFQECDGVKIYNWNNYDFCYDEFTKNPPEIILECFQCGRPDWLEKILFDDQKCDTDSARAVWGDANRIVNIIMIDYLSAEKYQEDFHCLKSLTRSARVQKVNFMPGFTSKTGGLLLPDSHPIAQFGGRVLFFAYKNDWTPVIRAMNRVLSPNTELLIAAGQGQSPIVEACKSCNVNFRIKPLDFMNQPDWDSLMWSCDLLFVRGEDSLAQSCLRGVPFIWQAYPQSEEYQTVKVKALLERMKPHFGDEFCFIENAWLSINEPTPSQNIESAIYDFLTHTDALRKGFSSFAKSLYENGDLASNLMTFIWKNIIIGK